MPLWAMSTKMLEQKIAELTQRVERLENRKRPVAKPTWRDAFGVMKDDEIAREAARLGAEWRAKQNKRR
jgi:uncharacterized small protein (DUF1192 family)